MKLIVGIIKPSKVDDVKQALKTPRERRDRLRRPGLPVVNVAHGGTGARE